MTNNDGDLIPFNPRMLPLLLFGPRPEAVRVLTYGEKAGVAGFSGPASCDPSHASRSSNNE